MSTCSCGRNRRQKVRSAKHNQAYTNPLNWDQPLNILCGGTLGGAMLAQLEQHSTNSGKMDEPHNIFGKSKLKRQSGLERSNGRTQCQRLLASLKERLGHSCVNATMGSCGTKVLNECYLKHIWAFQCKRLAYGLVQKLKSRFCAPGDCQMEGLNFFETYMPVFNWQTF
jgi:hypothetical protein